MAEVAGLAAQGDSFDRSLATFLEEFYAAPNAVALAAAPALLGSQFGELGRIKTPTSRPLSRSWPGVSRYRSPTGRSGKTGSYLARDSPRRWPRCGPCCCCWKVRRPFAPAISWSARSPCSAPEFTVLGSIVSSQRGRSFIPTSALRRAITPPS